MSTLGQRAQHPRFVLGRVRHRQQQLPTVVIEERPVARPIELAAQRIAVHLRGVLQLLPEPIQLARPLIDLLVVQLVGREAVGSVHLRLEVGGGHPTIGRPDRGRVPACAGPDSPDRDQPDRDTKRHDRESIGISDRQHQARQAIGGKAVAADAQGGLAALVLYAAELGDEDAQPVVGGGVEAGLALVVGARRARGPTRHGHDPVDVVPLADLAGG